MILFLECSLVNKLNNIVRDTYLLGKTSKKKYGIAKEIADGNYLW